MNTHYRHYRRQLCRRGRHILWLCLALLIATSCASVQDAAIIPPVAPKIMCGRVVGDSLNCKVAHAEGAEISWTTYGNSPEELTRFAKGPSASFPIPKSGGVIEVSYEDSLGKHFFQIVVNWVGDKINLIENKRWTY